MSLPTLQEIKKANPTYFARGKDKFHGTLKWRKRGYIIYSYSAVSKSTIERIADPEDNLILRTVWKDLGPNEDKYGFRRFYDDKDGCEHVFVNKETGLIEGTYEPEGPF